MMCSFSVVEKGIAVRPASGVPASDGFVDIGALNERLPKSMKLYSIFADQFGKNAYSTPIPNNPPVCVPLPLAFTVKVVPPTPRVLPTLKLASSQAKSALYVDQSSVECDHSHSAGDIGNPTVFDCAIKHQEARRVSLQIGGIVVAFDANNEYACSPVIASLDAAEEAVRHSGVSGTVAATVVRVMAVIAGPTLVNTSFVPNPAPPLAPI
jgi:hypothetical protein